LLKAYASKITVSVLDILIVLQNIFMQITLLLLHQATYDNLSVGASTSYSAIAP